MESQLATLLAKLETLVERFEKAQGSAPAQTTTAPTHAPAAGGNSQLNGLLKDFDNEVVSKIKPFEEAAAALGGDIIPTITAKMVSAVLSQKDVITAIQSCKRGGPGEDAKVLLKHIQTAVGDVKALQNKDPKFTNHVRTIGDGFGLFNWFAQPVLEEWKEEALNAINFYGFKVLQLKQDPDTAWQKAYIALAQAFTKFIESNKDTVTEWSGQASAADFFPAQLGKAEQQYKNPGAATDAVKQQAHNLFAEIQEKSLASQAHFKHVEKNAHKKEGAPAAGELPQPKKPAGTAAPAKEETKRPPKKELKYNQWYVENYGKEVLKFEGDDVQQNYGFALIKCQDTTLVVDGKCKTIMLENCTNVKVVVTSILANIEILNSKKITITIKEQIPQLSIERSQGIHLYLFPTAKNCKIHSTCSQSMVVHYPLEGATEDDEWLDIAIPETNVTQIKHDKLCSEALEGME